MSEFYSKPVSLKAIAPAANAAAVLAATSLPGLLMLT